MTPMVKRMGEGFEAVRREFGLARWQMLVACDTGLFVRLDDGSLAPAGVEAARADRAEFARRLDLVTPINVTEAAERLGVSWARARRLIAASGLEPCQVETTRYDTQIRRWRAGDIDALLPSVAVDAAETAVRVAAGRSEAARRVAKTRRRNAATAAAARAALGEAPIGGHCADQLRWAAALSLRANTLRGPFVRFHQLPSVRLLANLLRDARIDATTRLEWAGQLGETLRGLHVLHPDVAAARLGVDDSDLAGRLSANLDGCVLGSRRGRARRRPAHRAVRSPSRAPCPQGRTRCVG